MFADASDATPDELKGSARSIDGVHIRDVLDSIATSHPGLLIKFGGHAMAAGLSIKRVHLERFKHIFAKAVAQSTDPEKFNATLLTDGSLHEDELCIENAQLLSEAGPWGNGFAEPVFHGEFEVVSQRVVGETHLKLVLKSGRRVVDAIAFRQPPMASGVSRVLLAYKLGVNDFGDWPTVQLVVEYLQAIN